MTIAPRGKVLDATSLIHIATGKSTYVKALVEAVVESAAILVVPAPEVAAACVGLYPTVRDFLLERVLGLGSAQVVPVDVAHARLVGAWLADSPASGDLAASISVYPMYEAVMRGWPIVTADPRRYELRPRGVELEVLP